jgi:hypothetical protein
MNYLINIQYRSHDNFCDTYDFIKNKKQLFRGQQVPGFANKILIHYDKLFCNPHSIKDGDIIYCDTHQILQFKDILNLKYDLTIITHNSDYYVCDGKPSDQMGVNIDLFTCFKKWYAQNCYSQNPNVTPIPIGFENKKWEKIFGPKTKYINIISEHEIEPTELVYFNCNLNTNFKERKACYDFSINSSYTNVDQPTLLYYEYLRRIKQHKFILSPRGNGLDSHRTWEVLKLKRIPVIKREGELEKLYSKMPVLFVNEWSDLNNYNLNDLYKTFSFDEQDYLEKGYWKIFCK